MDVLKGIQGYSRTQVLSHAIRHLLDHRLSEMTLGDVAAVDILQDCMHDRRSGTASDPNGPTQGPVPIERSLTMPECKESGVDFLVLTSSHEQRVLGEIAIDREALQRVLVENPLTLTSLLDALLRGLDSPGHEQTEYSSPQTEVVGQMA